MSMRKYIRAMLRGKAEKIGAKPSKWVNREFDRRQVKKYGVEKREINKEIGTQPKSRWKSRIKVGLLTAHDRLEKEAKRKSRG